MSAPFTQGRALLVSVADYAAVQSLPDVVNKDAEDLAALLRDPTACNYPDDAVDALTDRNATKAMILKAFDHAAATVMPEQIFLFYFSGHGARVGAPGAETSYLLLHDSDLADLAGSAIANAELVALLSGIRAERQVVILDACHSGGVGTLKSIDGLALQQGFGKSAIDALASGRGRVILTSSRPEEVSLILGGMTNSLFTSELLAALSGAARDRGDGLIRVFDLFEHVAHAVPQHANQHPVFKCDQLEENFAIARRAIGKDAAATALPAAADGTAAGAEPILTKLYPLGPTQDELWSRAGGDVSRLPASRTGAAAWHAALRLIQQGGGGIGLADLLAAALDDYPGNAALADVSRRLGS